MTPKNPSLPTPPDGLAYAALLFAAFCVFVSHMATSLVRTAMADLGATGAGWEIIFFAVIALTAVLFWPATKAWRLARSANVARLAGDAVKVRIDTAASRDLAAITFGWGVFVLLVLAFFAFIFMNDAAVGRTFFLLPLIADKWWSVASKFITVNVVTFVIAEILVLVWGLIVALARMMPGPAGQPIRALATLYCDVFRGLPAIVTLYLIGFGIPTSGLPEMVIPYIYGLFVDTSAMDLRAIRDATRIPVMYWCILALTLTYGAYVAEVYRAGIESIHWSQVSAARSLGLSYLQTMRYVVVPQAVRRVVAPLLNDFIGLQKDTALVQILGLVDGFNQSRGIAANAFNLSAVTIVAALFVIVTIPQARLVDWLMERDARRMKSGG
ncbi:MAG: amino acid ABC transporter permease [Proteobacteria bacterium]|nr:amino acid ABC transporter permease [Pseudomonadota bacterium]